MKNEDFLREFGIRVKFYRIKKGLTQAQVGEFVDISEHRISQIENGKCNLTLKTVNKLADALGVVCAKLFDFED
ncbi:MAG: helix-turn-helix domain-containing protein [Muribaculaceae bacterium]|nr:helix-turn-helix domain-containing protein [Muribaculaceae bacterium]